MVTAHARREAHKSRAVLAGLVVLAWAGMVSADPPRQGSALDRVQRLNAIAAQRLEGDIRSAVAQAQRLATSNPDKAIEKLNAVVTRLEDDTTLPEERRQSLTRMLRRRIEAIKTGADVEALNEKDLKAAIRRFETKKDADEQSAKDDKLRRSLNSIIDLQKEGKLTDAKRQAEELAREFPSNPAARSLMYTISNFDQLASARSIKRDKESGTLHALRDVDRSSILPKDDIEFPKDWKERTKNRSAYSIKLSPREKAILRALNTPVSVTFKEDKFQDVMEFISTLIGQPILMNKADLNDASVNYDTPVTLSARNVTARTVLRKVLGEFGLTYVIKDEAIQIVSALKAKDMMVTRAYYIGDLLGQRGGPGDPAAYLYGPALAGVAAVQNIASIIDMIQTQHDPLSWQANGGPGSIFFYYPTMSLVIKQSAEVHGMIASGFAP